VPRAARTLTTYDVLMGEAKLADTIVPTRIPKLSLVAGNGGLSGAELEFDRPAAGISFIEDALEEYSGTRRKSLLLYPD